VVALTAALMTGLVGWQSAEAAKTKRTPPPPYKGYLFVGEGSSTVVDAYPCIEDSPGHYYGEGDAHDHWTVACVKQRTKKYTLTWSGWNGTMHRCTSVLTGGMYCEGLVVTDHGDHLKVWGATPLLAEGARFTITWRY